MIIKAFIWNCLCEKCGNTWSTRSDKVSKACPGCKSWTWNGESEIIPIEQVDTIDYDKSTYDNQSEPITDVSQQLASLGVSVGLPDAEPDEWEGWSDEKEEYDGVSGETIIYRQRLVKPFNREIIRREH